LKQASHRVVSDVYFGWESNAMNPTLVAVTYGLAVTIALLLLHFFHMRHWYWHALSIVAAIGIGTGKIPEEWVNPATDLSAGFLFVVLAVWGLAAPFFREPHGHSHRYA
jgi:hypothetical protein